MITIDVDNSHSKIQGLSPEQFKKLRELLSYQIDPQAAYFSKAWNRTKYCIDKYGVFPTGLLNRVKAFIDAWYDSESPVVLKDVRNPTKRLVEPLKLKLNGINPYPDQVKASDMASRTPRGGIVAPTGTGKSLIIALIAAQHTKTLVIVPSLEIKNQLKESLAAMLPKASHVDVENIDSKSLKAIKHNYTCLIIDECHHAAAKTYQDLNKTAWKRIYYRYFLTATFYRNQDNEQLLFEGICGEVIHQVTYKQAIQQGYIVPVEAYYIELPKRQTEGYTWAEVYKDLVVRNPHRNQVIADMLVTLKGASRSTLCLVKEIAHGKILSDLTGVPFVNGEDEESRSYIKEFNSGKLKALIGTTGVLGEGVDSKPAEYIMIAGLGKAKSAFMQQIGRGVRRYKDKESCKVILFKDSSHKFTLRHFKEQIKILKEEMDIPCLKIGG